MDFEEIAQLSRESRRGSRPWGLALIGVLILCFIVTVLRSNVPPPRH